MYFCVPLARTLCIFRFRVTCYMKFVSQFVRWNGLWNPRRKSGILLGWRTFLMLCYFCKFMFLRNAGIMMAERILFNSLKHYARGICHLTLTLENSTFCPHVARISFFSDSHNEQNFRKGINSLVFVTETHCVCCEVQTKIFIHFQIHFWSEMQFSRSHKHQNSS